MNQQQFQETTEQPVILTPSLFSASSSFSSISFFSDQEAEGGQEAQNVSDPVINLEAESEQKSSLSDSTDLTSTADMEALTNLLQVESRQKRHNNFMAVVWTLPFMMLMLWVTGLASSAPDKFILYLKIGFISMITLSLGGVMNMVRRSNRRQRIINRELKKSHDLSMIGTLIDTLRVENAEVRDLTKRSLIQLLPQMQASDAVLLSDSNRDRLLKLLALAPNDWGYRDLTEFFSMSALRREVDLRIAILKALEQVGGAKELSVVERLSRGQMMLPSTSKPPMELQRAAVECLPYLQERASGQRASEQLLRAAEIPTETGAVLLRAAKATDFALTNSVEEQQLLRAAHHD